MSKISVIVPTYNCGAFIAETLNSILNQTLPANEIFVVDDGSTDNTANVVSQIKDPRLHYIQKENAGVSSARNVGLSKATGDYIAFLDADDLWLPQMLEMQVKVFEKHPDVDVVISNFTRFDNVTKEILSDQFAFYPKMEALNVSICQETGAHILNGDAFCTLIAFSEIPAFTPMMMFRREVLANSEFNIKLRICQDLEFVLRIFTKAKVAFNPYVLAHIRRHTANATKDVSAMEGHKLNAILTFKATQQLSRNRTRALNDRVIRVYLDYCMALLKKGNKSLAWEKYMESLSIEGVIVRKFKGFMKLVIYSLIK
jgi:glycosyltransferase involved in cell wall biosynthesis